MDNIWPDDFTLTADPLFDSRIKPFITAQMDKLAALDRARAAWTAENLPASYRMSYIFHEHAQRVSEDMRATALYMGLPAHAAENLYWAMLPHDIGKHALPVHIWDMVEKPEDDIKRLRRSHTDEGVAILDQELADLRDHPFVMLMRDIMRNHHEHMDGSGFRGLRGAQLSAPVRLACIIESFDGYSIPRPHFGARDISPEGVLKRMTDEKGAAMYDMDLLAQFTAMKLHQAKK